MCSVSDAVLQTLRGTSGKTAMETFHFLGAVDHALSRLSRSFMGLKLPLCKMKMESLHCQFESSYFLCENGIRKPKAENLLFSSQAEAFCGGGFEAVTVKPCSAMMAVKPFFFFSQSSCSFRRRNEEWCPSKVSVPIASWP